MEKISEMYLFGFGKDVYCYQKEMSKNLHAKWNCQTKSIGTSDYLLFDFVGSEVEKSTVFLLGSEYEGRECVKVVNIIPIVADELSIEQYNGVLQKFYNDVVKPAQNDGRLMDVVGPTSDVFSPTDYISKFALCKLERFCNAANKTTGTSHPSDKELWFDFVCQTVDDGKMFDVDLLSEFLADESYWGRRENNMIVSGRFAWDINMADKLADEYEKLCDVLKYYKNKQKQ